MLTACGDNAVLKDFQNTDAGKEIAECAGVDGNIDWGIFKSPEAKNDKVRVIQAVITKQSKAAKKEEKFTMQWKINTETKIAELVFAAPDGEKKYNLITGSMMLAFFCMKI